VTIITPRSYNTFQARVSAKSDTHLLIPSGRPCSRRNTRLWGRLIVTMETTMSKQGHDVAKTIVYQWKAESLPAAAARVTSTGRSACDYTAAPLRHNGLWIIGVITSSLQWRATAWTPRPIRDTETGKVRRPWAVRETNGFLRGLHTIRHWQNDALLATTFASAAVLDCIWRDLSENKRFSVVQSLSETHRETAWCPV